MGSTNSRPQTGYIDDYGYTYEPYPYPSSDIVNYGTFYETAEEIVVPTTQIHPTVIEPSIPRRVRVRPNSLNRYGPVYPPGFNPMVSSVMNRPRVRVVHMPPGVYNVLQNLFQQGAFTGLNSAFPGSAIFSPNGVAAPQMNPGLFNPLPGNPFGIGPAQFSSMPYGNPFMQQNPVLPIGSNCFSVSLPFSPASSPYPIPNPCPPMQPFSPMMPPSPIGYPPCIPPVPCPSPIPFGPQQLPMQYPSPMPNIPQQLFCPPNGMLNNNGLPAYAGFPQYPGYGNAAGFPSTGSFPGMNTGIFGPQGLGAYGFGNGAYPYSNGYMPSGFSPFGQPMYPGFNPGVQNPLVPSPFNNPTGGGYFPQPNYAGNYGLPYGNYMNPAQSPYNVYCPPGYPGFNPVMPSPSGFSQSGLSNYTGQPYYPGFMPFCPPGYLGGQGQNFNPQQYLPPSNYAGLSGYGGPGYIPGYGFNYPSGLPGTQGQGPYGPSGLPSYGYPGPMNAYGQSYIPGYNQSFYPPNYCPPGFIGSQGQYPLGQSGFSPNANNFGYGNTPGQPYYANQYPNYPYQSGIGMQQNPYNGFYPPGSFGLNPMNQNPTGFGPNYQQPNPGYGLYNPFQLPSGNYPGFQGIPSIPQQPNYNYPGANPYNPYAVPPMPGFSPTGNGSFAPFPGRTGRMRLICCAIPE